MKHLDVARKQKAKQKQTLKKTWYRKEKKHDIDRKASIHQPSQADSWKVTLMIIIIIIIIINYK